MLPNHPFYDSLCKNANPYQAAMQIAQASRNMCIDIPHRLEMSRAIEFASNGIVPNADDYIDHRMDHVEDYLCGVADSDIADAVRISYAKSLEYNNLVYVYNQVHDRSRRAKIRIILKMLWQDGPYA